MKKAICMVLTLLFALSAQTALAAKGDKPVERKIAVVAAKTPLYKTATGKARIVTLKKGKTVTVTAENDGRYKVKYGKRTGYVIKGKLRLIPTDTDIRDRSAKTSAKTYLYANTYSGKRLVTLKRNAKLTVTAKNGKYYRVKFGKRTGYVLKTKIRFLTAIPAPAVKPTITPKPTETTKPTTTPTTTPKPVVTPKPTPKPPVAPAPTPKPTVAPTPAPTQTPAPQMETLGSGYRNDVLAGINDSRAQYGNAPLTLDSGLCAKAQAHAEEMARQGKIFHSCSGAESVSNSTEGGYSMGVRSAAHATGLAMDADRSRLSVGAVKYNGVQYTCVFAPRD